MLIDVSDGNADVSIGMQGNEFSFYMLLTSSFMLNHCDRVQQWTIFPWVLSTCNQPDDASQLRPVSSSCRGIYFFGCTSFKQLGPVQSSWCLFGPKCAVRCCLTG